MYLFCSSALRDRHRSFGGGMPRCVRYHPHIQQGRALVPCRTRPWEVHARERRGGISQARISFPLDPLLARH